MRKPEKEEVKIANHSSGILIAILDLEECLLLSLTLKGYYLVISSSVDRTNPGHFSINSCGHIMYILN